MGSKQSREQRRVARKRQVQAERRRKQTSCFLAAALTMTAASGCGESREAVSMPSHATEYSVVVPMNGRGEAVLDEATSAPEIRIVEAPSLTPVGASTVQAIIAKTAAKPIEAFDPIQDARDWQAIMNDAEDRLLLTKLGCALQRAHSERTRNCIERLRYALMTDLDAAEGNLARAKRRAYAHLEEERSRNNRVLRRG